MSIEKVKAYFQTFGREQDIKEMPDSCATVELAAQALGVEPARIAKTMAFKKEEHCVLITTAGDSKIDNGKFKSFFGEKAKMLTAEEVIQIVGHAPGGVCPFAVNEQFVTVYTDISLQRFSTIFPAAGSHNSLIELTCNELFQFSHSQGWIDICKGWQE